MNTDALWQFQDAAEAALIGDAPEAPDDAWRSVTLSHRLTRTGGPVGVAIGLGRVALAAFNHSGRVVTRVDRVDESVTA